MIKKQMPSVEQILLMRSPGNDAYYKFFDEMLSQVVGRTVWKRDTVLKPVRKIATCSDEAFAILLIENSFDAWIKQAEKITPTGHIGVPPIDVGNYQSGKTRYTANGAGTKKDKGWSEEGLKRYNELCHMVWMNRKEDHSKEFEQVYQDKLTNKMNGNCGQGKRRAMAQLDDDASFKLWDEPPPSPDKSVDALATDRYEAELLANIKQRAAM